MDGLTDQMNGTGCSALGLVCPASCQGLVVTQPFLALLWGPRPLDGAQAGCPAALPGVGHLSGLEGKRLVLTNHLSASVTEEAEDPACIPIFWVSKWVDYSDKYGLGRLLPEWVGGSDTAK